MLSIYLLTKYYSVPLKSPLLPHLLDDDDKLVFVLDKVVKRGWESFQSFHRELIVGQESFQNQSPTNMHNRDNAGFT